jgi:hypothetical protein
MPADSLETFRAAVFFFITPFVTDLMISGWAAFRAAFAASLSPPAIASSTLRMKVRMRERRALFTSVRAAILRTAFFADGVLAMLVLPVYCGSSKTCLKLLSQANRVINLH